MDSQNRTTKFVFHLYSNKTLCQRCSQLIFQPNNTNLFPFSTIQLYGIYSEDLSSFFFYGYQGKIRNQNVLIELIEQALKNLNQTELYEFNIIRDEIFRLYPRYFPPSYFFAFNVTKLTNSTSTFYSISRAVGYIYVNNETDYNFTSYQFDELLYISEGKIFGLSSSFSIVLLFIAFQYFVRKFNSAARLNLLSVHTFTMHVSFDFNFGVFLFDLSDTNFHLTNLFNLLFVFVMFIYSIEIIQLSNIWRASLGDLEDLNIWNNYFVFFIEIAVIVSIYSTALHCAFSFPYVCTSFMFSYLLPQIYHSMIQIGRKANDTLFNILVAVARLVPIFYFTCHRSNLMDSYSPSVAVFATCYIFLQILIVFLQNKFGGCFFLPKRFRPVPFNYSNGVVNQGTECPICMCQIEQDEETMVTPCNHAFHRECLQRWMEEQLACPVCRAQLPPVDV